MLIGCETDEQGINDLINGRHELQFLHNGALLVADSKFLAQHLSKRHIAREGIDTKGIKEFFSGISAVG
jgi:hypothetical protein